MWASRRFLKVFRHGQQLCRAAMGKPVQSKAWSTETLDAGIRHVNKDTDLGYIAAEEERIRKELEETHACKYDTCHEHFVYTHTHTFFHSARSWSGKPWAALPEWCPRPLAFKNLSSHAATCLAVCKPLPQEPVIESISTAETIPASNLQTVLYTYIV